MAATLRASQKGLAIVDGLRRRKGWLKQQQSWARSANCELPSLKRFWRRIPIDSDVFKRICTHVGADWEEIVDNGDENIVKNSPHFSQYDQAWAGRNELILELLEKLNSGCRLLILEGITGIGKTALAECLANKLYVNFLKENWKRFLIDRFDVDSKSSDFNSTAVRWLEGWGETIFGDDRKNDLLMPRLLYRLKNNPYLIILDSLEFILEGDEEEGWGNFKDQEWVKFFDQYLDGDCASRIIITTQQKSQQFNPKYEGSYLDYYILKGLTASEQLELFENLGLEANGDASNRSYLLRIGSVYEGHPLALKVIAGEIGNVKYNGNLKVYWEEYGKEIEEVEKSIEEAHTQGMISSKDDQWRLDNYSKALRERVKKRLDITFERLKDDFYNAYYLLCASSLYRIAVKKSWWLQQLDDLDCDRDEQESAFDILEDHFLVEWENGSGLVRQHNLIRSLALKHLKKIEEEEKN